MASETGCNESLIQQLPLPLAKLYRHASNAKSSLDRHQAAYFLWEAALKLLAAAAVATAAERKLSDPAMLEQLSSLARPSLGEWRKYVRLLVPWLAGSDEAFAQIKAVLDRSRDDLPRAAGLDALLREQLENKPGARSTVCLNELFDRLVTYRNREVGHGAPGLRDAAFYDRLGRSLLSAVPEILARIDVLAGRRLVHVADVSRTSSGNWLIDSFELIGESPRRLDPQELPAHAQSDLLIPGRVYLADRQSGLAGLTPLYPLAIYNTGLRDLLLLNAQRGKRRCEYLCYSSGDMTQVDELGGQMSEFLTRIFGRSVPVDQVEAWAARSNAEDGAAPAEERSGLRSIGEFELLSVLGQGGMGVVYRAWQPSLGRQVALKCLLRAGDAKSAERFAREYRALARVEHPHLVKVYTSGSEGDQWFYAMELIEGVNLADVCEQLQGQAASAADVAPDTWKLAVSTTSEQARRSERPINETAVAAVEAERRTPVAVPPFEVDSYVRHVVELVRQVASALDNLHQAGIIHRDIKPGNIMLASGGSQAVLMDLGLAQWIDKAKLTQTRQFVGTLRYASPEQVLAVGQLDGRSDVYSLGATLWELLTLRPMFGATDEMPTPELMKCIQYEEPQLVEKFNPRIAPDLQAVVAKCLQKNPARRYQSATALAADLGRWLRDEPVEAQATDWRYRAGKFMHRNRKRIGTAVVVVAAQAAVIAGLYFGLRPTWDKLKTDNGLGLAAVVDSDKAITAVPPKPKAVRRALLIGCGKYDHLPAHMQSDAPANDVDLTRATLQATFGFELADFVELSEAGDLKHRPTRANILAELDRLIESAVAGQSTFILLSGQSTAHDAGGKFESIFVPSDADKFDPATKQVKNAITSSEFRRKIDVLAERGATVFVVCDLCWPLGWAGENSTDGTSGVTYLYAAREGEIEVELPLPQGSKTARKHGLLTFTMCETLLRAGRPLSYAELVERINDRYLAMGRSKPNPCIWGRSPEANILGELRWAALGTYLVTAAEGDRYTIGGGSLQGLTRGCLLEVLERADQPDSKKLGILRVTESDNLNSQAIPFEFETIVGDHEPIPVQSKARLTYIDFGELQLKVAIAPVAGNGESLDSKTLGELTAALGTSIRSNSLFELVNSDAGADWLVWMPAPDAKQVFIVKPGPIESTKKIGPLPIASIEDSLPKAIISIARAGKLLTLAQISEGQQEQGRAEAQVSLKILKFADPKDKVGVPLSWKKEVPTLEAGDLCGWSVSNASAFPVDVTLLYIDSDFNIRSLFPRPGSQTDNRLAPGQTISAGRAKVNAVTTGIEHVMLIATRGGETPIDFSFLESSTIEAVREAVRRGVEPTLATPLGMLFQSSFFGEGNQRGMSVREINRYVMRRWSWQVKPVTKGGLSSEADESSSSSNSPTGTR